MRASADRVVAREGVIISVDPVGSLDWRQRPELIGRILMRITDTASQNSSLGGGAGPTGTVYDRSSGPPGTKIRYEDFLLVPLPAFHLRVENTRADEIDLSHMRARLEEAGDALSADALLEELNRKFILWANRHQNGISNDQLSDMRVALGRVPLFGWRGPLATGAEGSGYLFFRLASEEPVTRLVLIVDGVFAGGQPLPPFRFPFVVDRRHAARACPDGSLATPLGECKGDELAELPADEGPCIQKTRMMQSDRRYQWWIGGEPVADSDVHRTLMSQAPSGAAMRQGLILRGLGYGLAGAGLLLSAASTAAIAIERSPALAASGLSLFALTIAGGVVGYLGVRRTERAIRIYNEQSDSEGTCSVVW